jgi:hypothetical protein
MKQEKLRKSKLKAIRDIESTYDVQTGQKLYKPRVDNRSKTQKIFKKFRTRPDLKTEEYFIKDCTEFMKKCRQIFNFLDVDKESAIYSAKLNNKIIHPNTFQLISCILIHVISYERMEGSGLPFPLFYKMVRENELEEEIMNIFFAIEAQPGMRRRARE